MEEQTTTNASVDEGASTTTTINGIAVDDQGMAVAETEAQPEETEQAEAVDSTPEQQPEQEAQTTSEPSEDDQLTKWAEAKGLTLDSDNAIKAAKMAREAEKAMHQKAQRASELEKSVESVADREVASYEEQTGELVSETDRIVKKLLVKDSVRTFFEAKPEAKPLEQAMVAELQTKPHLAGDLDALYAVALVNSGKLDTVKSDAKRETLEALAQKQQASAPTGNAVNAGQMSSSNTITPQNVDQLVARNDQKWFEANYDKINRAMAGQTN